MRDRKVISDAAGPGVSVEQLQLEVLLDVRDLLQQLLSADSDAPEVDVEVKPKRKGGAPS